MRDTDEAMQAFAEMLTKARGELERLRATPGDERRQLGVGKGRALDGRIEVEMAADGRISGLTLDPAVLKMDERMLAREIMTAVNTAWAARSGVDEATAALAAIDTKAVAARLTEIQDQSIESMRKFNSGMQAVIDRLESRVPR